MRSEVTAFLVGTDHRLGSIDAEIASRIEVEQVDVTMRLAPLTLLLTFVGAQVNLLASLSWSHARYIAVFEALSTPLVVYALVQCWRWRTQPRAETLSRRFVWGLIAVIHIYGLLLSSLPIMLFADLDVPIRVLIAACCAGLISAGLTGAAMPLAALSFSAPISLGSFIALWQAGGSVNTFIAFMLALYSLYIGFMVLHLSRLTASRVIVQVQLEREQQETRRQQEWTNLLLNDFEESASDWLWETDGEFRLQHISHRLVEVTGCPEDRLRELTLDHLFQVEEHSASTTGATLWRQIQAGGSFSEVVLSIHVGEDVRWWSVSGKPIYGPGERFMGYRGVGSDVTEKVRSEQRLSHLALHDPLTELPNRAAFQAALDAARAHDGGHFAVLCLDLDAFKAVNDTFGHATGDALLRAVAERLHAVLASHRSDVLLARLAGDEFAVLCTNTLGRDPTAVAELAARCVDTLATPFHLNGIEVGIGASIGIALSATDGSGEIMQRADVALYRTKAEGRNGYRFYDATMDEGVQDRRALTADLRLAVERNEFFLHYQPIVDSGDGRVISFEALVRWAHPVRGLISPADFIPLAEETGLIIALGEWVLQQACRVAVTWPLDVSIAVNVSVIQVRHSDLPSTVARVLAQSGLDPRRLEIEVTESVFLDATPATSYLRQTTFDKLKIDGSFVSDLPGNATGMAITRAMVELSSSIGLTITAECVEEEDQRICLRLLGCHQLQGYLFSRPVPAEAAAALLARQHTAAYAA